MIEGLEAASASHCGDGWHTILDGGSTTYIRAARRLRDAKGTIIYRVGSTPNDAVCTTIWDYSGKGRPWKCTACRKPITPPETLDSSSSGLAEGVAQ
jgi:hypothetical protein